MELFAKVFVGGQDVTKRFLPRLVSVSVTRSARSSADTASINLADPEGTTFLPPTGAEIMIKLGHIGSVGQVFEGFVDSVRSSGSKSSGRSLAIKCNSVDNKSRIKEPGMRHSDQSTFKNVAVDWGDKVGLKVSVSGSISSDMRPYWIMQNESYQQWGNRISKEIGASFKVIGKNAFFAPLNEGISATGKPLTAIVGEVGLSLLDWDIAPIIGRPQYKVAASRHYDMVKAKWERVEREISSDVNAVFSPLTGSANVEHANQRTNADKKESERQKGGGSATIVGDWAAEPEAEFHLKGARPGVDGTYTIDSLTHSADKSKGFVTSLQLKLPKGGAGVDGR